MFQETPTETILRQSAEIEKLVPVKPPLREKAKKKAENTLEAIGAWFDRGSFLARWVAVCGVIACLAAALAAIAGIIGLGILIFNLFATFGIVGEVIFWLLVVSLVFTGVTYADD